MFDTSSIIILITLGLLYVIFLIFDAFKRGEKYSLLAYAMALPIINYLWYLGTMVDVYPEFEPFGVMGVYFILIILWIVVMLRDAYYILRKKKDVDDVLLFLLIALIVQFVLAAVLPYLIDEMQNGCSEFLYYFYFPALYDSSGNINSIFNSNVVLMFRISASLLVGLICVLLVHDVKDEELKVPALIIITAIFIIPFAILSFIWAVALTAVLTFLFCVILFIALLLVSKPD